MGVTTTELIVAAVTVSVVVPDTLPWVAVMSELPRSTPLARPLVSCPLGFIVAIRISLDDQITEVVMLTVVASE